MQVYSRTLGLCDKRRAIKYVREDLEVPTAICMRAPGQKLRMSDRRVAPEPHVSRI